MPQPQLSKTEDSCPAPNSGLGVLVLVAAWLSPPVACAPPTPPGPSNSQESQQPRGAGAEGFQFLPGSTPGCLCYFLRPAWQAAMVLALLPHNRLHTWPRRPLAQG